MSGMLVRRTDDRSRRAKDGWAAMVLPCWGQPRVMVARCFSMRSSASPASKAGIVTSVAPWWTTACRPVMSPPTQKNGMAVKRTSSLVVT
jgi:hypothetical protein